MYEDEEIEVPANLLTRPRRKLVVEIEYIPLDDDEAFLSPVTSINAHVPKGIKLTELMVVTGSCVGAMAAVVDSGMKTVDKKEFRDKLYDLHFTLAEAIRDEPGKFLKVHAVPKGL